MPSSLQEQDGCETAQGDHLVATNTFPTAASTEEPGCMIDIAERSSEPRDKDEDADTSTSSGYLARLQASCKNMIPGMVSNAIGRSSQFADQGKAPATAAPGCLSPIQALCTSIVSDMYQYWYGMRSRPSQNLQPLNRITYKYVPRYAYRDALSAYPFYMNGQDDTELSSHGLLSGPSSGEFGRMGIGFSNRSSWIYSDTAEGRCALADTPTHYSTLTNERMMSRYSRPTSVSQYGNTVCSNCGGCEPRPSGINVARSSWTSFGGNNDLDLAFPAPARTRASASCTLDDFFQRWNTDSRWSTPFEDATFASSSSSTRDSARSSGRRYSASWALNEKIAARMKTKDGYFSHEGMPARCQRDKGKGKARSSVVVSSPLACHAEESPTEAAQVQADGIECQAVVCTGQTPEPDPRHSEAKDVVAMPERISTAPENNRSASVTDRRSNELEGVSGDEERSRAVSGSTIHKTPSVYTLALSHFDDLKDTAGEEHVGELVETVREDVVKAMEDDRKNSAFDSAIPANMIMAWEEVRKRL